MNITSGADIIAIIILIALAIAIIVYLLHWLYRRSSKEIAFVRTGMGGEQVVISGGAFVLPIIHNITSVGMKTLCIEVQRNGSKSFITKNRMRAEVMKFKRIDLSTLKMLHLMLKKQLSTLVWS
jgi:uncharacterized membrane protein YqiK